MKAIRLVLKQNKAHYRKEETVTNKMTYPLPPFSTVIGAIHNACNYREYHPMDLSIQGSYESLGKEVYTDHCFLNSVMDDRGILIKTINGDLQSTAFTKVAKALKGTGNSFRKGITIQVYNQELMDEYLSLKDMNDAIAEFKKTRIKKAQDLIKARKKTLKDKKKKFDKKSNQFKILSLRENEIKNIEKLIKDRLAEYTYENYSKEISKYQSLTTAPKYYEVLYDVKLVIHINADEQTLQDIKENIYNLRAIGRSEDSVDVEECEIIELEKELDLNNFDWATGDLMKQATKLQYINLEHVKDSNVNIIGGAGIPKNGTKFYMCKDYKIENHKRIFNKKKVILTSKHTINENAKNVYVDTIDNENYVLSFV